MCHACHNSKCSTPEHLYWGTRKENILDAKENGTWKSAWERMVDKYGYNEACRINAKNSNPAKAGAGNKGKPKTKNQKPKTKDQRA